MKIKINRIRQFVLDHDRLFIAATSIAVGSIAATYVAKPDYLALNVSREQLAVMMNEGAYVSYEISPTQAVHVRLADPK